MGTDLRISLLELRVPQSASGGQFGGGGEAAKPEIDSVYGRKRMEDFLRALSKLRGAFAVWVRSGNEVRQKVKRAVPDLLDVLAEPTSEYAGVDEFDVFESARALSVGEIRGEGQ